MLNAPISTLCPLALLLALACSTTAAPTITNRYAPPAFADSGRRQRVEAVLAEIDKLFHDLAVAEHLPGLVYGVVLDGELLHSRCVGFASLEWRTPATNDTRFRIASMTKSFVALATLRLRDQGKLALDDPVEKYLPEFRQMHLPTADSRAITIRNLMTMSTGLPEDNPWGDRQMAITEEAVNRFVRRGLSFSNPPGQAYEYSNLGFVLLGKIVSKAGGMRFQDYITQNILRPLGMKNTEWEFTRVPAGKLALGYRWEHGAWKLEPMLPDGAGAAMGGLITTLDDFARYVAFHLNAWPARDDVDPGPVRRATVREMHQPRIFSGAAPSVTLLDGKTPNPSMSFYGYGLGWNRDSRGVVRVSHSGGLPGFGSIYRFCPDYGVGVIAFANLRYAPIYAPANQALSILLEHANLPPRAITASPILLERQRQVTELIQTWDVGLAAEITAGNFFLDRSREDWIEQAREKFLQVGKVVSVGPIAPENQLRGTFSIIAEKGKLEVKFTLSPEAVPKVQELELKVVPRPSNPSP